MKKSFILASGSPQRKKILRKLGVDFKVVPADIDEDEAMASDNHPRVIAKELSLAKAEVVSLRFPAQWVIGSDTLVVSAKGEILGKPKNKADAIRMIKGYQDSFCDIYSGLAFVCGDKKHVDYEKTRLYFKDFSKKELDTYIASGDWRDRSGAMTIEGTGDWIKKMEGDYWNVVGLPVNLFKEMSLNLI